MHQCSTLILANVFITFNSIETKFHWPQWASACDRGCWTEAGIHQVTSGQSCDRCSRRTSDQPSYNQSSLEENDIKMSIDNGWLLDTILFCMKFGIEAKNTIGLSFKVWTMKYYLQMEGKTSGQTVNNIDIGLVSPISTVHIWMSKGKWARFIGHVA